MISIRRKLRPGRLWLFLALLVCALPVSAHAQQENRLRRITLLPHAASTTIRLFFQDPPDYTMSVSPGRIRLTVRNADTPLFRKLRGYADPRVKGVFCSERYGGLSLVIPVQQGAGVQALQGGNPAVVTLLVGREERNMLRPDIVPGREPILSGTERFVRNYGVPARAGLPFAPTDVELLKRLLPDPEVKLFQRGEGFIYKEQGKEAAEVFTSFLNKSPAVQALAWYRLGESLALLERKGDAVAAFRRGEALWPAYLDQVPELMQVYAELRAEAGDFRGGRDLLARLIARLCGTVYAPPVLNHLANLWERHGDSAIAEEMYRTVVVHAPGTEAATRARMKLADREMFSLPRDRYPELLARYSAIYEAPGDQALRDEALFKMALLQALYGPARQGLDASVTYDVRYPHGIFSTIVKNMREELLLPVYRDLYAAKDYPGLVRLVLENKEYLARCFSDPELPQRLLQAFHAAGMLTQEVKFFGYLNDRSWAAAAAPYLSARVVEDALTLGNLPLAESTARGFLSRYPKHAEAQRVREELGRIAFEKGDLKEAAAQLSFLAGDGKKPQFPESDYYLGKALAAAGDQRGAERSLARFTADAPGGSPLVPDGYFAVAGARVALKEYPAALAAYQQGAKVAKGEEVDQFLYKMGELYLKLNMVRQAKESWQKVTAHGGGGTWVKLASEALGDLQWRLKIAGELP